MKPKNSRYKRLYLIDAYSLAYRGYFAFINRPLRNSKGENTSAIYIFTTALTRILEKEQPEYIGVIFDTKEPTFRHQIYEEYKATRDKMPEDLSPQIDWIKRVVRAFNIPVVELPGYEADDIMGTIAKRAASEKVKTYLVTGDKDFSQLVEENVVLYKPGRSGDIEEIVDISKVVDAFGVNPENIVDLMALTGDQSDNIPGVRGIGNKTALPLIQKYGNIENLYEHIEEISNESTRNKLLEQREKAFLSKKLATIETDTPVDITLANFKTDRWNIDELTNIFKDLEFNTFLDTLTPHKDTHEAPAIKHNNKESPNYKIVNNEKDLNTMISELKKADEIVFDTETTTTNPLALYPENSVVGVSFSSTPNYAWYINLRAMENGSTLKKDRLIKELKILLESKAIVRGGHNLKFDILALLPLDIKVTSPLFDTMIASYILNADKSYGQKLENIAKQYLDYDKSSYSDLVGKGKKQLSIEDVDINDLARYSCEDADITLRIWNVLKKEFKKESDNEQWNPYKLCLEIEFPLIEVLASMEAAGVTIDVKFLKSLSEKVSEKLFNLQQNIYRCSGREFNINSTQQLGTVLFKELGLRSVKKTKTGFSTDLSVLEQLQGEHPIIEELLDYRQLTKLTTTYIDTLPKLVNSFTNRIHTSYNQTVTSTGRLSSSNPNLQNIPIRTEIGREIRKAFIPRSKDHIIMSTDYSQIELRIMAHLSGDPELTQAFKMHEDIHSTTAVKLFGVREKDVTPEMRRKAKEVNFGIIYGISPYGLSSRLNIPQSEASDIINKYYQRFPKVKKYIDKIISDAKVKGYVSTLLGRKRHIPEITSRNNALRQNAIRQAINMPIQGTAADMIKMAMVKIHSRIQKEKLKSHMIIQVHDELVFDVYKPELEKLRSIVEEEMIKSLDSGVPIEVETGVGSNWLDAH